MKRHFGTSPSGIVIRRNRNTHIAFFVSVLGILLTSPKQGGFSEYLFYLFVFAATLISLYTVISHIIGLYIVGKAGDYSVISSSNFPNPGKTMMDHLKESGVAVNDLASIKLVVYDLSNTYIGLFAREIKKENPNLKIYLSGKGSIDAETKKRVDDVHLTEDYMTRHENIIKTLDGNTFIWFEPRHSVTYRNGKEYHSLPFGAFLLKASG